jgi:outer membrane protein OmpA-like peptidoglycan-associated protein
MYQQATAGVAAFHEDAEALKHNFLLRGYFKNRGYENADDITKNQIAQLPASSPSKTFVVNASKLFDKPDTAKLKNQPLLKEAGEYLQANHFGLAVIAAAAGMKVDSDKDRLLTEARAAVVRDYLAGNFKLDDRLLKTIGLGKTQQSSDQARS